MPPTLLDRLPLPTIQNYVIFSLTLTTLALVSSWTHIEEHVPELLNTTQTLSEEEITYLYGKLSWEEWIQCFGLAVTSQLWTLWAMVNMCYCVLSLIGKGIQVVIFGKLRVSETQQLKERFWNFAFYKFIFIFGVLNVQYMNDVFVWSAWFSFICGLQLLAELSKHRYDYLSCSPATPKVQHIKLIFLLILITLIAFCLVAASVVTGLYTDWNIAGFMVAECLLLLVKAVYVIFKYTIYLVDLNHDGLWETRGTLAYYTDLISEMLSLAIELLHYLHMLMKSVGEARLRQIAPQLGQVWITPEANVGSDLAEGSELTQLTDDLQKRYNKHRNYLQVVRSMEARFAEASPDDITAYDDNCAICWDKMQRARKLPCGHLFHNSCLRSWLAQDVSCPTCRVSLSDQKTNQTGTGIEQAVFENENPAVEPADHNGEAAGQRAVVRQRPPAPRLNRTNHLFHFDASRYVSWLPSFSVEVTHTQLANRRNSRLRNRSTFHAMGRQVQNLFPSVDLASIIEDLRGTQSMEITIENILEGRLTLHPQHPADDDDEDVSSEEGQSSVTDSDEEEVAGEEEEIQGAYALPLDHNQRRIVEEPFNDIPEEETRFRERATPNARRRYLHPGDESDSDEEN